jgi:two-component system response regulator VicR
MKNGSKTKKILIIEDEKPLATALVLKLQKQGHTVTVAHDGKMAVELMARELYDVALLDLIMPIMDGFEVLKAARKLPAVPVFIVLSNLTQPDDTSRIIQPNFGLNNPLFGTKLNSLPN